MAINALNDTFDGRKVIQFEQAKDYKGPTSAYRLSCEYDDETPMLERLATFAEAGGTTVEALIIGSWGDSQSDSSAKVINWLVERASSFPNLKSLFIGEMTFEECEISWIQQSDLAPLLVGFPKLEVLRARGGEGLAITPTRHANLRELGLETGGLSADVVRQVLQCEFPNLNDLDLWLGSDNYGYDGSPEDLQPLMTGRLFPSLKHLRLRNSEVADDIAALVVNAPILERLETLDLSLGELSEAGARSLMNLKGRKSSLKTLDISHHYVPTAVESELRKALPGIKIIANEAKDPNEEWRSIYAAE